MSEGILASVIAGIFTGLLIVGAYQFGRSRAEKTPEEPIWYEKYQQCRIKYRFERLDAKFWKEAAFECLGDLE